MQFSRTYIARNLTLCLIVASSGGCATQMTVAQFVNSRVLVSDDPALVKLVDAANKGQAAFNFSADTPIRDVRKKPRVRTQLREMLNNSRDAYRQAASYQSKMRSSSLDTAGVELIDLGSPNANRVPIPGTEIFFRVAASPGQVIVQAIESVRGLPVVLFDSWMKPTLDPRFRPFLQGDRIDVESDLDVELGRGDPNERYDEADDERGPQRRRRASEDQSYEESPQRRRPPPPPQRTTVEDELK